MRESTHHLADSRRRYVSTVSERKPRRHHRRLSRFRHVKPESASTTPITRRDIRHESGKQVAANGW